MDQAHNLGQKEVGHARAAVEFVHEERGEKDKHGLKNAARPTDGDNEQDIKEHNEGEQTQHYQDGLKWPTFEQAVSYM